MRSRKTSTEFNAMEVQQLEADKRALKDSLEAMQESGKIGLLCEATWFGVLQLGLSSSACWQQSKTWQQPQSSLNQRSTSVTLSARSSRRIRCVAFALLPDEVVS